MFSWLTGGAGKPPVAAAAPGERATLDSIRAADVAVVFKHSRSCPVSWFANTQVRQFTASHPEVPLYTVLVQEDRDLSRDIAEWTGVRHESPQVILLMRGNVVSSASHDGVTAEYLASAFKGSQSTSPL